MDKSYVEVNGEKVWIYQVCEYDAVAAGSKEEALRWYKHLTGLDDEELYAPEDIEIVSPDYKAHKGEDDFTLITVREIVKQNWNGEPFIALTSNY